MDRKVIGDKLRKLRDGRKQSEVARACGITTTAYSMYETGQRLPIDDIKLRLAKFYGTTVQSIFYER